MTRVTIPQPTVEMLDALCREYGFARPEMLEALIEGAHADTRPVAGLTEYIDCETVGLDEPFDYIAYIRFKAVFFYGHEGALLSQTADELESLLREQQHTLPDLRNTSALKSRKIA